MTTVKLSDKESVTITPKHGQVELHMIQGFLALSKRLSVTHARLLAAGINAACDQLTGGVRCHNPDACKAGQAACPTPRACGIEATSCPPCNGNCNQGRDCPARA